MIKIASSFRSVSSVASVFFVALIVLSGCSDPKNYEITKLTDEQKKELGQKLTSDEGQKLAGWMMRNALAGKDLPAGMTVAQALKDQDEWIAKQKQEEAAAAELKKKVDAERKAKQEEFAKLLTTTLISKKDEMGEYGKRFVNLDMAYENKSDRGIQGVKGVLRITDIFGDKIMNITWSYDKGIQAKKRVLETGSGIDINQFMSEHMKLWNTDFDKLKSSFEVETIIFEDGTRMDAPS